MIFNWIEIKNFKSYGDYETRIDLNVNESRLLLGENGAGKTTFVDAIIWSLYGKSLSNADDIINRQTKTNCKVEVNFDTGNDNYSIIRYRNHEVHKNSVLIFRGKENISPRTANEAQTLILDIIEINYNAMVSSIIFSSELYISFLRSKPSDRLKIFENILSLKEIQLYHNTIKEMRKPIKSKLEENILEKSKCNHEIEFTNETISEYKEKSKNKLLELKESKDALSVESTRIGNDLITFKHISVDEELLKNELSDTAKKTNKEIQEKIDSENINLKNIDGLSNELADMNEVLDELLKIDVEVEKKKNSEQERITHKNQEIRLRMKYIRESTIDEKIIQKDIEKLKDQKEKIENEIKELREHSEECPMCGQDVEIEFTQKILTEKELKHVDILSEIDKLNLKKTEATEKNQNSWNELQEENSKLEDDVSASKYNEDYLNDLVKKISDERVDIKLKEQEIIHAEEINENIIDNVNEMSYGFIDDSEYESSAYNTEYLNAVKENIDNLYQRLEEIKDEVKIINAQATSTYDKSYVEKMNNKILKINNLLEKINKKIAQNTLEDNHYNVLQQLFSNKSVGVKKYIIDNMLHVFNEKVNFYLPFFFSEDTVINFSKDLEEEISVNGSVVPFTTFSSGEKTRLELAIAFSLFMVVKIFFSSSVNLLVFDEILDMNLDSDGVESVLNIINNLSEDNSIIVISHREEYKENFANQIYLRKNSKGFSKISIR